MEDFKRPNHNDFKDSAELRKENFSGIRHNSITDNMEFWIDGRIEFEMPAQDFLSQQDLWKQKMADCLGLTKVEFDNLKGN